MLADNSQKTINTMSRNLFCQDHESRYLLVWLFIRKITQILIDEGNSCIRGRHDRHIFKHYIFDFFGTLKFDFQLYQRLAVDSCNNKSSPFIDFFNIYGNPNDIKKVKKLRKGLFSSSCSCWVGIFSHKNRKIPEWRIIRK